MEEGESGLTCYLLKNLLVNTNDMKANLFDNYVLVVVVPYNDNCIYLIISLLAIAALLMKDIPDE